MRESIALTGPAKVNVRMRFAFSISVITVIYCAIVGFVGVRAVWIHLTMILAQLLACWIVVIDARGNTAISESHRRIVFILALLFHAGYVIYYILRYRTSE